MITVFGSINFDLIGGVERLPRPGETVSGGAFATAAGGKGANQALAAARAGARVRMVGAVGGDEFAAPALALLREGGVNLTGLRQVEGATGVALILVDGAGENVIAVMPGANATVSEADAEELQFGPDDVLLLQLEVPVSGIDAVARRAKAAGARVLLNFAPFRADALALLPNVTHLIVNESECDLVATSLAVSPTDTVGQALALAVKLDLNVVATLGKDGAIAASGGEVFRAAALAVQVVDTVGAGDTFCGYLATALGEGRALVDGLALAAAAGSLACTRPGAQPSIPKRAEVAAALRGGAIR